MEVADNDTLSFGDDTNDNAFGIAAWIYMTEGDDELELRISENAYAYRKTDDSLASGWHFIVVPIQDSFLFVEFTLASLLLS